jgi:hypothetical protein
MHENYVFLLCQAFDAPEGENVGLLAKPQAWLFSGISVQRTQSLLRTK